MITLPEQKIRWLLAELTVVVLGILLALQIDEWRLTRSARAEERAALISIMDELEAELVSVNFALESTNENIAGVDRFVELIGNLNEGNIETFAQAYNDLTMLFGWRPISPTYAGLRETGRLNLIQSPQVRAKLYDHYEIQHPDWRNFFEAISQARTDVNYASSKDIFHSAKNSNASAGSRIIKTNHSTVGEMQFTVILPLAEIPRSAELMPTIGRFDARLRNAKLFLTAIRERNRELLNDINTYLVSSK